MARYKLNLSYDGGPFRGFAINEGVPTVGGALRFGLEQVLQHDVPIVCAGRTDAGVHALDQVVSFDTDKPVDPEALRTSLNQLCKPHIVVNTVEAVADEFDARFSCTGRSYRYRILNQRLPDPFRNDYTWRVSKPLNVDLMQTAAQHLLGTHDFSSFCRRQIIDDVADTPIEKSRMRNLRRVDWTVEADNEVHLNISANAFCQQMVRSITGLCVEIGLATSPTPTGRTPTSPTPTGRTPTGRTPTSPTPADVPAILAAKDRNAVPSVAPPHGLYLISVTY